MQMFNFLIDIEFLLHLKEFKLKVVPNAIFTSQGIVKSYLYTIDCIEVRYYFTLTCEDAQILVHWLFKWSDSYFY